MNKSSIDLLLVGRSALEKKIDQLVSRKKEIIREEARIDVELRDTTARIEEINQSIQKLGGK